MTKALLLASATIGAALLSAGAASAQTPLDWSGFYVGGHAGYLTGKVDLSDEGTPGGGDISGFIGGVLGGYMFKTSPIAPFALGVEADFGWADVQGHGVPAQEDNVATFHYDLEWDAHFRVVAGLPMGNLMPFVAGGLALADLNITENQLPLWNNVYTGGTIGAGLDIKFAPNIIGRAEVLYDFFPKQTREDYTASMSNTTVRIAAIFRLP